MSFATGYAMKKRAKKACYGAKMADGGAVGEQSKYKPEVDGDFPDKDHYVEEKASGYEDHEGNDVKSDMAAMDEDDRELNQHGEEEEGPQGGNYADGGMIEDNEQDEAHEMDMVGRVMKQRQRMFADGGMVDDGEDMVTDYGDVPLKDSDESEPDSPYAQGMKAMKYAAGGMIDRIMRKHYSKGGQVANDVGVAEADKLPAEYDDLVLRDDDMEDADYTGENSGDELSSPGEDERRKDIIYRIMKSRAKKDRMPRPA